MYQARGGRGASMMRVTLSVIWANASSPASGPLYGLVVVAVAIGGRELRMGVLDAGQVVHTRAVVELLQELIGPVHLLGGTHAALGVVQVAEDDGSGRAACLARGLDGAVGDGFLLVLAGYLDGLDALHAERALFHDATATHRHLGIEGHRLELGPRVLRRGVRGDADRFEVVVSVVEATHLVGAV